MGFKSLIIGLSLFTLVAVVNFAMTKNKSDDLSDDVAYDEGPRKQKKRPNQNQRSIASTTSQAEASWGSGARVTVNDNPAAWSDQTPDPAPSEESPSETNSNFATSPTMEDSSSSNGEWLGVRSPSNSETKETKASPKSESSKATTLFGSYSPSATVTTPTPTTVSTGDTSSGSSTPPTSTLSCSASSGGGTFNAPESVALTCSSSATIQYCLSQGSCCDPSSGSSYSSPITVGTSATTYCLSYIGTSTSDGATSVLRQHNYTFNPLAPSLTAIHEKIQYQTTELIGITSPKHLSIASSDFGKQHYGVGIVNLVSHDPSGLNLSCEDIVENHSTLTSPSPVVSLVELDASAYQPSNTLDIILPFSTLRYGDNYLSSYMKNGTFSDSHYACRTTNVVLADFPYFDAQSMGSVPGSNQVREFAGGFTHLGFFEADADVNRTPAGNSTRNVGTQELRSGLFGMFF